MHRFPTCLAILSTALLIVPDGLLAAPPAARTPRINPGAPTSAYLNGLWYEVDAATGAVRFVPGDRYSLAGIFTAEKPEQVDRTIDLEHAYVIPPFGEAHNHNVDGPWTLSTARRYLKQGIFYHKNPNDIASVAAGGQPLFNKPDELDVVFAHGGLSIDEGHPEQLYKYMAPMMGLDPKALDGQAFFDVPTPEAVTRRWPEILKGRPDFLKLYLLNASKEGGEKSSGLTPETLRRAVKLAGEAGLSTTVHVETAADLALAVDAGATEAAHLPGYSWGNLGAESYRITDEQARRMADRGFLVVTTTVVSVDIPTPTPELAEKKRKIQALQVENLKRLHAAGVPLAIGADSYTKTALDEAKNLRKLGAFIDRDLLRLWVETAPKSIFPRRSIGQLTPGHEASFLALAADPDRGLRAGRTDQAPGQAGRDAGGSVTNRVGSVIPGLAASGALIAPRSPARRASRSPSRRRRPLRGPRKSRP